MANNAAEIQPTQQPSSENQPLSREQLRQSPVWILSDTRTGNEYSRAAFENEGFSQISTRLYCRGMDSALGDYKVGLRIIDLLNDFGRVGAIYVSKAKGARASGRGIIHFEYHQGGYSNEEGKYNELVRLIVTYQHYLLDTPAIIIVQDGEEKEAWIRETLAQKGVQLTDKTRFSYDPPYIIEEHACRVHKRRRIITPRPEFFTMAYEMMAVDIAERRNAKPISIFS